MLSDVIVRKATRSDAQILAVRWLVYLSPCWMTGVIPAGLLVFLWSSDGIEGYWKFNLSVPLVCWIAVVLVSVLIILGKGLGIISMHTQNHEQWVAAYGKQVIGEILLNRYDTYSHIENLMVIPRFRRQGVASKMVHQLSQYTQRPLYVQATTELMPLYIRLGFVPLEDAEIPEKLRELFGANRRSHVRKNIKDFVLH